MRIESYLTYFDTRLETDLDMVTAYVNAPDFRDYVRAGLPICEVYKLLLARVERLDPQALKNFLELRAKKIKEEN